MILAIQFPRILHRIGEALLREPLGKQVSAYQAEREQKLASLRTFEKEVLRLRGLLRGSQISIWAIDQSLREWCGYSDAHYYINMAAMYRKLRFDADADRVLQMSKHGQKKTVEVKDEHGNFSGIETVSDGNMSNAVEFTI